MKSPISTELRAQVMAQAQGTMSLHVAFVGVANHLFEAADALGPATVEALAARANVDAGYLRRFCEAAYAFGYLDVAGDAFALTDLGRAFLPGTPGTLMPLAVHSALGAHMADRATELMRTGERPGEKVLAERPTILPWFGPMLEASFGPLFEREILPALPALREVGERGGVALDLGCGNGWYVRRLCARFPALRGVGVDGFAENVRQAGERARAEGLAERTSFRTGDLHDLDLGGPFDLVAMNRALHHVWDRKDEVFARLAAMLAPGGVAVIWEPAWPDDLAALREPRRRGMAIGNLNEHVQGNHFLRPREIEEAFRAVGLAATTTLFGEGAEAVVVARKG
jgi:SAM-dependent methyltransferase